MNKFNVLALAIATTAILTAKTAQAGATLYISDSTATPIEVSDVSTVNAPNTLFSSVEYNGVPETITSETITGISTDTDTSKYAIGQHDQFNHGSFGHSSTDSFIALPEPASLALVGLGLLGLGAARRRIRS